MSTLDSQEQLGAEIAAISAKYAGDEAGARLNYPPYRSSGLRYRARRLQRIDPEQIELHSPAFGHVDVDQLEADLTIQHSGIPIGERMKVRGRVLDGQGRPVRNQLIEI